METWDAIRSRRNDRRYEDRPIPPEHLDRILEAGGNRVAPIGLGARDTLRLEMGYPLHGHELGPGITPLQAGLSWVVAWDGTRHVYLRDADVAFQNGRIVHVGKGYDGPVEREIDARERLIMPGLIDVHSHPSTEPLHKGLNEELGSRKIFMSGLYEIMPLFRGDEEARVFGADVSKEVGDLERAPEVRVLDSGVQADHEGPAREVPGESDVAACRAPDHARGEAEGIRLAELPVRPRPCGEESGERPRRERGPVVQVVHDGRARRLAIERVDRGVVPAAHELAQ